jgi:hypothetical protein
VIAASSLTDIELEGKSAEVCFPVMVRSLSVVAVVVLVSVLAVSAEDKLIVKCGTTQGDFRIELHPAWSPKGVVRFVELVQDGFFDGSGE